MSTLEKMVTHVNDTVYESKRGIRDYEIIRKYAHKFNGTEEVMALLKEVFYWEHTGDINHKKPSDLYSFDQKAYNTIIHHMLSKLSLDC